MHVAPQSLARHYTVVEPEIRRIEYGDLREALRLGLRDFMAMPSHLLFIGLIYPIMGIVLASLAFGYELLPLVYPLISGFALLGPLAAIGLYELSRRREAGLDPTWQDAFEVLRSPSIGAVLGLGAILVTIFLLWLGAAQTIFRMILGPVDASDLGALATMLLTTPQGWAVILIGNAVGGLFAALALLISVVGFPAILDRGLGVGQAIGTSARAVMANPGPMAAWGAIVAVLLALGSLPLFIGLAVVMPVLGHATWHLYRTVVVR